MCFFRKIFNKIFNNGQWSNPLEAARYGCTIFHGPNCSNFTEIYDYLTSLDAANKITNIEELTMSLDKEFEREKKKNEEIVEKIENYGKNILNNILGEIKRYINNH